MILMIDRHQRRHRLAIVLGLLVLLVEGAAAKAARADWLVTREGGRVETKGPWQIKGKLVVFTRADSGSLSSLRAAEVDLDASAKATAEAKTQAEAPPPPEAPKKKLAVLTDDSFRKPAPPEPSAETKEEKKPAATGGGPLAISSWKRTESANGDGLVIEGTLHNTTGDMIIDGAVEVQLYNEVGDRVGTAQGLLTSTSIQPNGSADFHASFPGVFTFTEAKFQPKGIPLDMNPPTDKPPEGSDQKPADQKPADASPPP
jgi:hypothetical protein